ncbi:ABC transporter ATP-binding protein [Actinomadura rudentiformis]|uniref:ABC transporter ATP-binding protein n=1 Tax=Actinomadura rudentiformis TaxID=359158 RepID=A0A6H9Z7A4_9ACTN|nr:ABC transporter ATP-binding protein [Actinomadura rudentiformis]KAB2349685.1 ABC transporter ATP-binding protein [Actinomadura rudentiformis]
MPVSQYATAAGATFDAVKADDCPLYEVAGLGKSYGDAARALDGVGFEVRAGEVFGVLGRNGAGKSTLVRHLVGLLRPDAGTVRLLGTEIGQEPRKAAEHVAYLPQAESALSDMSVRVAVETTARLRGIRRKQARGEAARLLDELALTPLADRRIGRLSGGQRRLAEVATALAGDRRVLVLDEPTTGLDVDTRHRVWGALRRRRDAGVAIVLVTHNVAEAETVLDRVLVLRGGRMAGYDTPGGLKAELGDDVRLDLAWRDVPPEPLPEAITARAVMSGRRWSLRLPSAEARGLLSELLDGPAFAALDDFTLRTPSLEDVLLAGEEQ